jgi:acetyl-CoA carboxylase biotin carboxyl carrier protein
LDIADLKEILRILEEQDITEFELEQDGVKLRVCRSCALHPGASPPAQVVAFNPTAVGAMPPPPTGAVAVAPTPNPAGSPAPSPPAAEAPASNEIVVKSPIVGTFYRAPDPNAAPFVDVGDRVKVGQVLCIIEAMKLMNEIEAEVAGEVLKIHPENGQPVQYGDPLFTVRAA